MSGKVFVDTWGWLAIGHRKDPFHKEVKAYYQTLRADNFDIVTSDYVLDEAITLIFRREVYEEAIHFIEGIFQASEEGYLTIDKITEGRFASAWQLRKQFKDKPLISFTDITTMVIMQERGIKQVLTRDEHFTYVGMGFQLTKTSTP